MGVPTTFSRGEEGEFLVRTFVEKYWGSSHQGDKQSFKEGGGVGSGRPGQGYKPSPPPPPSAAPSYPSGFGNVINIPIHVEGGNPDEPESGKVRKRKRLAKFMMNFFNQIFLRDKLAKFGLDLLEK